MDMCTPQNTSSARCADGDRSDGAKATEELFALIKRVKDGDSVAFSALCERYSPLTVSASRSCASASGLDEEDCAQEAVIALYFAATTFVPGGVTFGLYAKICVRNRLYDLLRREKCSPSVTANEESLADIPADEGDPETAALAAEHAHSLISRLEEAMSERERSVFRLYILGSTYREMASRLGVTEKSVDNTLRRVKAKCRRVLSDN